MVGSVLLVFATSAFAQDTCDDTPDTLLAQTDWTFYATSNVLPGITEDCLLDVETRVASVFTEFYELGLDATIEGCYLGLPELPQLIPPVCPDQIGCELTSTSLREPERFHRPPMGRDSICEYILEEGQCRLECEVFCQEQQFGMGVCEPSNSGNGR